MDCIFSWVVITCIAWYGGIRFLLAVIKADEERKTCNCAEWDEMW